MAHKSQGNIYFLLWFIKEDIAKDIGEYSDEEVHWVRSGRL
jgi:hypothetical protein